MRRHVIVGRFGIDDQTTVPVALDEVSTHLNLGSPQFGLTYGIGKSLNDLARLGITPSEIGLDLLILATHVFAADNRISRLTESQDSWTREIRLVVPVSNSGRWTTVVPILERMLNFLTGDQWTICFRQRSQDVERLIPQRPPTLFDLPYTILSLFSGGLDSLIGAIDMLDAGEVPLLISHAGDGATSNAQNLCYEVLKANWNGSGFNRFRAWMSVEKGLVQDVKAENSTRGRSFLFFALGALAGTGLPNGFTLRAPENGLIALNVPLDILRLGSHSTRTTHPFYIARWNELLAGLGIAGRVSNPYWDKTKGEMVAQCRDQQILQQLIPSSLSCSSPTKGRWQGRGVEHCGYCLPCLIRRAAISTGLAGSDPTTYTLQDLGAADLSTLQSEGKQVRSFQYTIRKLLSKPELSKLYIHKPGPLTDEPSSRISALADVYLRGMNEVGTILSGVRTRPL